MNNGHPHCTCEITDYEKILLKFGITYRINDSWLEIGYCDPANSRILYISVLSQDAGELIDNVAPLLQAYSVPFRLLKNSNLIDLSTGLAFGIRDAGKVFMIYPSSGKQAAFLAGELELVTTAFEGIIIDDCIRIGKVLYTAVNIPFKIPRIYRIKKRKGRIGKYYVPIRLLKFNPKGDINLGVNLKRLSFTPCIIKQARAGSFTDKFKRESFHRLQWQKTVLEALQDKIPTPHVIDFCRKGRDHYLIIEYIEGENLLEKTRSIHGDLNWKNLPVRNRNELLDYFLQIVEIIKSLHHIGYLHRDIQINNFIIKDQKVYIIDFELAYYMPAGIPNPAFSFGTAGFVSPEQKTGRIPSPAEDIYSLGAVLAFMILNPQSSLEFSGNIYNALVNMHLKEPLLEIVVKCLDPVAENRPSLPVIINALKADHLIEA
jgi:serine/threonine protein kinase